LYAGEKLGNLDRPNRHIAVKKFWPYRVASNFFKTYSASVRHTDASSTRLRASVDGIGAKRSAAGNAPGRA
jgi:hypothetical protein